MNKEIIVSIICNAYNHENYIKDALDSFLMQKTNFKYEILIHDDASTDNTANIIKEYAKKYPEIIKPIYQYENKYSQKIDISLKYQIPRAKGKYLAWCEGDDYWTDEYKLQKQVDALESNPSIDICTHAAYGVDSITKKILELIQPYKKIKQIDVKKVILGNLKVMFVATSSILVRKNIFDKPYSFYKELFLDYFLLILGTLDSHMLYLNDFMSCYRMLSKGSWTERLQNNPKMAEKTYTDRIKILDLLNLETEFKYIETINSIKLRLITRLLKVKSKSDNYLLYEEYKELYHCVLKNSDFFVFKYKLKLILKKNLSKFKKNN